MAVDKELLKGTTSTLVLQLLARKKMYGYEIIKDLEILSGGLFEFKEGTLYPLLHNLEESGFVSSEWVGEAGTRQRKYYFITKDGRAQLREKKEAWLEFSRTVEKIFLGKEA
ncbi:MAG: helix-turn-helix transcriptional regulator [Deltaproteobacteria bacterium]|jgi:PadR family transcriptional regulator PadR|nr:helix-turn-helix transcriptional regulator [Deltaproteobacteria bacterium]